MQFDCSNLNQQAIWQLGWLNIGPELAYKAFVICVNFDKSVFLVSDDTRKRQSTNVQVGEHREKHLELGR